MTDLTQPIDALHEQCLLAQRDIRAAYTAARRRAAHWTPRTLRYTSDNTQTQTGDNPCTP